MNRTVFVVALRLRLVSAGLTAAAMAAVIVMVGALFPSVGNTIGKLNVPDGVANLLGGADYGTITGWMRTEIGAVYGPLVVAATAILAAASSTAGEEEAGILALVLAHPVTRAQLVVAKAAAAAVAVLIVVTGLWIGLIIGVAIGGGGISLGHITAIAVHLVGFGFVVGGVALALATTTGRKALSAGGAAAVALFGFLVNGFAPFITGLGWTKYLSPFYYYAGHDPIARGVDLGDLAVLGAATAALVGVAVRGFQRRDLRA